MPGELLPVQAVHNAHNRAEVERFKGRYDRLKQRTDECENRRMATQSARVGAEHNATRACLQKVSESKGKRSGKCKSDSLRPKATDQSSDVRNDHHDMAINNKLKRPFEMTNPVPLMKPNNMFNGRDSLALPGGNQMPNYQRMQQQYDFTDSLSNAENAKKPKLDSNDSQFRDGNSATQADKIGSRNGGNGASVSVQILFNNESQSQSRIKTTVNVNTSIDAENSRGSSESQSVSVNVGNSKDVKQEAGKPEGAQNNANSFAETKQTFHPEQNCMNNAAAYDEVFVSELNNILEVIDENESDFNENSQNQADQQQNDTSFSAPEEIFKDNQFQCKTEKLETFNFASSSSNTKSTHQQHHQPQQQQQQQQEQQHHQQQRQQHSQQAQQPQQFFDSSNVQQKPQQPAPTYVSQAETNMFKTEKRANITGPTSSQMYMQQNIQMQQTTNATINRNPNPTSQHIQKLSVSVDNKFNLMNDQKQMQQNQHLQQQQFHTQQSMMPNVNRNLPGNSENTRPTPDGHSRLSHQPCRVVTKSISPNPVSYSVSHQPHPNPNYNMPGQGHPTSGSYFGSMPQHGMSNAGPVKNDMPNIAQIQRPSCGPINQRPSQGFQPNYSSMMQRQSVMDQSKALQLKEIAEKRGGTAGGQQWNNSISASIDMSSNVSFSGQNINHQQRMSADMRSFTSFQNVGPGLNGPEQASGNLQHTAGNYGAASAAAREVLAASQRQQSAACGNSLNHFPLEDEFSNKHVQPMMTAKSMYSNRVGMPSQTAMHGINNSLVGRGAATQQMIRPGFNDMATVGAGTGVYNRQPIDPGYPQNHVTNRSVITDSMNARIQQTSNYSGQRIVQIQRQQQQQNMYKQGIPQGGAMSQRGPSPLPTPPISPGHNMAGSMVQARIQANNPTGMFSGASNRNGMSGAMQRVNIPMSGSTQSWNMVQSQSFVGNASKMPPGYTSNQSSIPGNLVQGAGYPSMNRVAMRSNPSAGNMQRSIHQMQGSMMGRNQSHLTTTNQPSPLSSHNMAAFRQQPTPFSPSGMNPNSGVVPGNPQMTASYPTVRNDAMIDGLDTTSFHLPRSPNVDLNLFEYIDGN